MYSDLIVHQARILQLKAVSDGLLEIVDCPDLEFQSDAIIESLLSSSNKITTALQSLVGFRDIYSNYEKLLSRLKSWLQKAEAKMDLIALQPQTHPYDFWVNHLLLFTFENCKGIRIQTAQVSNIKIKCHYRN